MKCIIIALDENVFNKWTTNKNNVQCVREIIEVTNYIFVSQFTQLLLLSKFETTVLNICYILVFKWTNTP